MQSLTTERLKDSGDRRGTGICFGEEPKWLLLCNDLGIFQGLVFRYCWIIGNHNRRVEGTEDCSKKDRVSSATGSVCYLTEFLRTMTVPKPSLEGCWHVILLCTVLGNSAGLTGISHFRGWGGGHASLSPPHRTQAEAWEPLWQETHSRIHHG